MSETRARVLIVEDTLKWQKAIMRCELLKQMRQRDPGSVVIVDTYQAAEDQLDACQFDLAITDVVLEENEGQFDWRSLARLLQQEQVPIVVVSGHLALDLVTEMVNEYGVFGVFDKHRLDPHKLSSRLSSILATRGGMPRATPGSKGVTWLHLSDLHFALSEQHDRSVVIEALWRDLERCRDRGLQANFIIVTGDVAYSGKVKEYKLAGKFLDDLLDHTKVPKERLFLVPGNHDVDRSKILTLARQVNALNNRNSVREVLEEDQSRSLFMRRLEGYASFTRSYFSDSADALIFDNERYFYCRKFIINDWHIAVLGLNSTWTSGNIVVEGKVIDKGQLAVGEKQVMDALQMARDAQVKIAVMHHPLSYLYDFDRNDVANLLSRGCHFLLHGHLHEADVERRASLKGEMIVIPAGAIYQGRELINSYNYVTLDFERSRAQVIFRRYSDAQREWLKDLDATGETADGELEFDLQL